MKSKLNAYCTVFFLAAVCIFGVPVSASAFQTYATASGQSGTNAWTDALDFYDVFTQNYNDGTPSNASIGFGGGAVDVGSANILASATTHVGQLQIGAFAASHAVNAYPATTSYVAVGTIAFAKGMWNDAFTIDGGALNGQTGHMVANFSVDGSIGGSADETSAASLSQYFRAVMRLNNAGHPDGTAIGGKRHRISASLGNVWDAPDFQTQFREPGIWPVEIDFTWGTPILVSMWGDVEVRANANATHGAYLVSDVIGNVDFLHTMAWNGITGVTDSLGNPVTSYTVSSQSGFDYRYAFGGPPPVVPEPATLMLLGGGLAGLALWGRYRARRS